MFNGNEIEIFMVLYGCCNTRNILPNSRSPPSVTSSDDQGGRPVPKAKVTHYVYYYNVINSGVKS